jgi:hypothetical protein
MRLKLSTLLLVLLLPACAEALDSRLFLVSIQGFPLSLGRLFFVISGLTLLFVNRPGILKNKIFIGFALIFTGLLFASLLSGDKNAIVKSLAFILLFTGSFGIVTLWEKDWGRRYIDVFFIVLFSYWSIKSLGQNVVSGSISYAELYQEGEVVNHHVAGMLLTVSSAYIAIRFFYSESGLKIWGYLIFFISLIACLFIESRSNFLVSFMVMSYIVIRGNSKRIKRIIIALPVLMIIFFSLNRIIAGNEILQKRFTLADMEYQEKTTGMRWNYINQGLEGFIETPMGKGIIDTQVIYKGRTTMVHNQYLTFLLGGGIIALFGFILLVIGFFKVLRRISRIDLDQSELSNKIVFALTISCLAFFVTLFTIEMSGMFFFFMCSFLLFVEKEILGSA